jgi:hypothetical protein
MVKFMHMQKSERREKGKLTTKKLCLYYMYNVHARVSLSLLMIEYMYMYM